MRASTVVGVVLLAGCATAKIEVLPALTPIDASRAFVIHGPQQGTACGPGAVAAAINDLFRISSAHGFVAAVVDQQPDGCVTVTARPITYGCDASPPVKVDQGVMRVVPGNVTTCAPAATNTCETECARYANANTGGGETENNGLRERCISRCRANNEPFMQCARAANTPVAVKACDRN